MIGREGLREELMEMAMFCFFGLDLSLGVGGEQICDCLA